MACLSAVHAELVCSSRQIESSSGALDQAMAFFVAEATPATTTTSYTIGTNPRVELCDSLPADISAIQSEVRTKQRELWLLRQQAANVPGEGPKARLLTQCRAEGNRLQKTLDSIKRHQYASWQISPGREVDSSMGTVGACSTSQQGHAPASHAGRRPQSARRSRSPQHREVRAQGCPGGSRSPLRQLPALPSPGAIAEASGAVTRESGHMEKAGAMGFDPLDAESVQQQVGRALITVA
jgi:hypothetical protein